MRPKAIFEPLLKSLLLSACLFTPACGGGGGGGGGGTPPPPPPPTVPTAGIVYTAGSAPAQESVTLSQAAVGTTQITLEVRAVNVEDLFGVSFDLTYPSGLLRLDSAQEGDWLSSSGSVQTSFLTNSSAAGRVVVGLTRLGDINGRTGSGDLVVLQFTAIGSGNGTLTFSGNEVFDHNGLSVDAITWAGGSVQVQL